MSARMSAPGPAGMRAPAAAGAARWRRLRVAGWWAAALLSCALGVDAWRLGQAVQVNRDLARAGRPDEARAPLRSDDPRVWIVASREPARSGRTVEAAALLRRAADAYPGSGAADARARAQVRPVALYDLGNVYLRAALELRDKGADALALPLFELAKESYRAALLERGDLWDAKFNLELALRALPDVDPDESGAPPVLTGERAVTTMRALTLGLP